MLSVRTKVFLGSHKLWNLVNYLQNHPKRYLPLFWFLFCACVRSLGSLCCFKNEREGSNPDTLRAVPAAHSLTRESGEAARSNGKSGHSLSGWKWGRGASCERDILIIKFPRQQASQLAHTGYIGADTLCDCLKGRRRALHFAQEKLCCGRCEAWSRRPALKSRGTLLKRGACDGYRAAIGFLLRCSVSSRKCTQRNNHVYTQNNAEKFAYRAIYSCIFVHFHS